MDTDAILAIALSLALGLVVGLQRERHDHSFAGVRTFSLITLLGTALALLVGDSAPWVIGLGLLAVTGLMALGNWLLVASGETDLGGMTTEAAALLMYTVGACMGLGELALGAVLGGLTAVLLQWRDPLHRFAAAIGERDARAFTQLVLIALVVLPLVPDRSMGPLDVVNPYRVWLMVTLIVAISISGWLAWRLVSARAGGVLGGIVGGLVSSTATTVSYARQAAANTALVPVCALVVAIASVVSFLRILVEVAVVAPGLFVAVAGPVVTVTLVMALATAHLLRSSRQTTAETPELDNPAQLGAALTFGALYVLVLLAVAGAREYLGTNAMYLVAFISGLTDVDAITLSTAELYRTGGLEPSTAWRLVLVAALANLVFKGAAAAVLGGRALALAVAVPFGAAISVGAGLVLFWPS